MPVVSIRTIFLLVAVAAAVALPPSSPATELSPGGASDGGDGVVPELILSPGLPSLESLNITMEYLLDLANAPELDGSGFADGDVGDAGGEDGSALDKRQAVYTCGSIPLPGFRAAVAAYTYLRLLGRSFCRASRTPGVLVGITYGNVLTDALVVVNSVCPGTTQSFCSDVAAGVRDIIMRCRRIGGLHQGGRAAANGNGCLQIYLKG